MDINTFLHHCAESREGWPSPGIEPGTDLSDWQSQQRELVWRDWGLDHRRIERAEAPKWTVTRSVEQERHVIDCGWFEPSPGLVITANLYRPAPEIASGAAMIYLCGHHPDQKVHYQEHARKLAQLGFTTLIVDTVQHGEVPGLHHGLHSYGAFHWVSRGYSPAATEAWAAIRAYDLLSARSDVDSDRIGATGHSGGGAVSWWLAVLEPRIRAVVTSTGTAGEVSHLVHRTIDSHCDCYFPSNPRGTSLASLYAIVAPRPVLVLAPRFDLWCEYESVVATVERLGDWYATRSDRQWPLQVFGFDAEHAYTSQSRRRAFGWLVRHVRDVGADTAPGKDPGDFDGVRLERDQLRVFAPGETPTDARNATVSDWILPRRGPTPSEPEELARVIVDGCFSFARIEADLASRVTRRYWRDNTEFYDLRYDPEPGWSVEAMLRRPRSGQSATERSRESTTVILLDRDSPRMRGMPVTEPTLTLAVRGTGRSSWHPQQDWHLRRATAMLGRTLGAMRVYDVIRGLAAHRELFGDHTTFTLVARREMAFPALLAALLEPRVGALRLSDLPDSLDLADQDAERDDADGSTFLPQAEITGLLRIADVADILRAVRTRADIELT